MEATRKPQDEPARTRARRGLPALALTGLLIAGCASNAPTPRTDEAADRDALGAQMQDARAMAAIDSTHAYWPYRMAELQVRADSLGRAEQHLREALRREPGHEPSLALLSKIDFDAGRHDEAIARLEAARERRGSLPEALRLGLALHYEARQDFESSDREFAASESLSTPVVYHALRGDGFESAGEIAERVLREQPRSAAAHNNYAITRLYAGQPAEAKTHLLRALELEPEHPGALYNLAIVEAFYFFDEDAARGWFDRYVATGSRDDPDDLSAHFGLELGQVVGEEEAR